MENNGILVDTSVIIEFFRKANKEKTLLYKIFDYKLYISAITVFELLAGATSIDKRKNLEDLFEVLYRFCKYFCWYL